MGWKTKHLQKRNRYRYRKTLTGTGIDLKPLLFILSRPHSKRQPHRQGPSDGLTQ